jgi:FAD/FMN-containing dehydrogenase
MKNGIGISMRRMKTLSLHENGESATIGPGLISGEVIDKLSAQNKRTGMSEKIILAPSHSLYPVTGSCACAGMIGPMLGGGHGILQGHYGTLADNLVEARVVLSEGNAVTVSAESNADLFWALRGAGHNFGIISEYKFKVYDHAAENKWAFIEFMFTGHQLEDVYRHINEISDDGKEMHPVQLVYLASYLRVPEIDSQNVRSTYSRSVHVS